MKKVQYVSKYIALSNEGLVSRLECPLDQGLLLCNQDLNEAVYLYCLSCTYKNFIGQDSFNNIKEKVDQYGK